MSEGPIEKVVECFDGKTFPHGLSPEKIYDRANVVEDENRPNQIVFEMERHHPIFGERHISGFPMKNFKTELCRYAFDPEEETLTEVSRSLEDVQIDEKGIVENIMRDVLSFNIEPKSNGFHVKEVCSSESRTLNSKDEFINWARKIPEDWYLDHYFEEVSSYMKEEELKELKENVLEGCKDKAEEEAKRAWARQMKSST